MGIQPGARELLIHQIPVGPMGNYAYVAGCPVTRRCVTIDAAWEIDRILALIAREGMTLSAAFITHGHPDHVGGRFMGQMIEGLTRLIERVPVKIVAHRDEVMVVRKFTSIDESCFDAVDDGAIVPIGERALKAIHTPGHSPGGVCWFGHGVLFSGDTLFITNCGRVDLPGADADKMFHSLTGVLAKLPDETMVYPGHAYDEAACATMAEVKRVNPYLSATSRAAWGRLE